VVIHHRNPLADDRLQLIKVKNASDPIQPAECTSGPLYPSKACSRSSRMVRKNHPPTLIGPSATEPAVSKSPAAHTLSNARHIDLAVIDNNRFRHDRRPGRTGQRSSTASTSISTDLGCRARATPRAANPYPPAGPVR
jgi:hypothetical protein